MTDKRVLVANGQGFWGDSILGPIRLLREGPVDYITLDYLAEVTLSIMQKLRSRDPSKGYATDFVALVDRVLPELVEKNVRIVANAGGVNPHACVKALLAVAEKHGVKGLKIGVVEGDDILADLDALMKAGEEFRNMDTGEPLSTVRDTVTSANVYLGAFPIAEALDAGAQIVLTGRGTDPGLVLGPLIHEFGWAEDDYDRLAAGTIAGHIVECGAQCTGGNYTDWRKIPDMANVGYPIIDAGADGSFAVTKHEGTGGLVTLDTVGHQLVYEMGDPSAYITPDCIADFSSFQMSQEGENRVLVSGVRGAEPHRHLQGLHVLPRRLEGHRAAHHQRARRRGQGAARRRHRLEAPGLRRLRVFGGRAHGGAGGSRRLPRRHSQRHVGRPAGGGAAHGREGPGPQEGGPLRLGAGAPGDQRPAGRDRLRRRPPQGHRDHRLLAGPDEQGQGEDQRDGVRKLMARVELARIAAARSGDKGEGSNVGVLARSDAAYAFLKEALTEEVVRVHFREINPGGVTRYAADNMRALNFLLADSLGGGGSASLKTDAQGKTHGLALLRLELDVPDAVLEATPSDA